jgi:hypothetical protein
LVVRALMDEGEGDDLRPCVRRGWPYGNEAWVG